MTARLVELPAAQLSVVDALRDLLAEAERGEIHGLVVVTMHSESRHGVQWAGPVTHLEKIGALEYAKTTMVAAGLPR